MARAERPEGTKRKSVSAIVLAAGASTRMGRSKLLLPLDGRPILQHVIDEVAASCVDEIVLVLGAHASEIRDAIRVPAGAVLRIVVNGAHPRGQASSLAAGLRAASIRADAAAVVLGDQPGLGAELIDRVIDAFHAGDRPIARPVHGRRRDDGATAKKHAGGAGNARTNDAGHGAEARSIPGHPVVIARGLWRECLGLRGDAGARTLIAERPQALLEVAVADAPPEDIDTPADYRRAGGTEHVCEGGAVDAGRALV